MTVISYTVCEELHHLTKVYVEKDVKGHPFLVSALDGGV
jgi:hypothetical protein